MQPNDLAATLVQQAITKLNEKNFDEAAAKLTEAIRLDGSNADALYQLSNIQADRGQLEDAIINYEKAVAINPNLAKINPQKYALLYFNMGHLFIELTSY